MKAVEKGRRKLTRSSGNVFRDLGFAPEEAEHLLIRSDLMTKIAKLLKARRLKQAEAAKAMGVSQPRASDLRRGRIDLFSTDALIDMLCQAWRHRAPGVRRFSISQSRLTARLSSGRLLPLSQDPAPSCAHRGAGASPASEHQRRTEGSVS